MIAAETPLGASTDFLAALRELRLLRNGHLEKAEAYARARGASESAVPLAEFLVREGALTAFQAETVLVGRGRDLVLSNYVLLERLGSGTMGVVYKARSSADGELYAIKTVPRRNVVSLPSIAEKVKAFKEVRHPRVSALIHIGAIGDRVYLVWPFVDGGEKLDDMVKRLGKLTPRQAIQVALQTASGLQAYHGHGLYHGLLKPSDILIGTDRRVRLVDFGVGFLLTSERGKSLLDTMTNTKALNRGIDCASPESIVDPLDRTSAGDQYSLGCILYYCLAGQFPFPSPNPVKKLMGHQFEMPRPIRELNPLVPAALEAVVHRMLQKKPGDRYASPGELTAALQALSTAEAPPKRAARAPFTAVKNDTDVAPAELVDEEAAAREERTRVAWMVLTALALGAVLGVALMWFLGRR